MCKEDKTPGASASNWWLWLCYQIQRGKKPERACLFNSLKMISITQNVLMALTVTVNQFASSNVHAVQRREAKRPNSASVASSNTTESGRRGAILSSVAAVLPVSGSRTQLLKKYLKKSQESKAKND